MRAILCSLKKKEILSFATTWMELDGIMLKEISETEKDWYHMISFTCEAGKTTHRYRGQTLASKGGRGGNVQNEGRESKGTSFQT